MIRHGVRYVHPIPPIVSHKMRFLNPTQKSRGHFQTNHFIFSFYFGLSLGETCVEKATLPLTPSDPNTYALSSGGDFFLACEDFGENVRSFIPRPRFFF